MKVRLLTEEQKNKLYGELVQINWYFSPIRDVNGNWIISEQETEGSSFPENDWVKSLPQIDWTSHYIPLSGETIN